MTINPEKTTQQIRFFFFLNDKTLKGIDDGLQ